MKVISIDPATKTGAAWTDGREVVYHTWQLPGGVQNHGAAILELQRRLRTFITEHGCDLLVFEDASFGSNNRATAAYHNALRGGIETIIELYALPKPWKYNPSSLKKATTGSGKATKDQMIATVNRLYGLHVVDDNAADAVAMAMLAVRGIKPVSMVKKDIKQAVKRQERKLFDVRKFKKAKQAKMF